MLTCMSTSAHMHTHNTHVHTHTHACTQTHIHARVHTHTQIYITHPIANIQHTPVQRSPFQTPAELDGQWQGADAALVRRGGCACFGCSLPPRMLLQLERRHIQRGSVCWWKGPASVMQVVVCVRVCMCACACACVHVLHTLLAFAARWPPCTRSLTRTRTRTHTHTYVGLARAVCIICTLCITV
jgi:hypothetical protein